MLSSLLLSLVLSLSVFQTKLGSLATYYLQKKYDVHISVNKIDFSYLGEIKLRGILIKDHHKDTLMAVSRLQTSLLNLKGIRNNNFDLAAVSLSDGVFNLKTYLNEKKSNLAVFSQKIEQKSTLKRNPICLETTLIKIDGIDFEILNLNKENDSIMASYKKVAGELVNFLLDGPNVSAELRGLNFIENHGIEVQNLTSNFSYTRTKMRFKETILQTASSSLRADIVFDYKLKDLKDFNNKVQIDASFTDSDLSLSDLNRLYKKFGANDVFHFSTNFKGTLNDFKLTHFDLYSDQKFTVKGDYHFKNSVKGGDDFFMDGLTDDMKSNYSQLKKILPNLLSKNLPSEFVKLGDFTIKGATRITSKQIGIDIVMFSELGKIASDLLLTNIENIDEATYEGTVKISDFNLGKIVRDSHLGKTSLNVKVVGKGFTVDNINASLIGSITKHQYKGYTYRNISVNGFFKNRHFNGELQVRDKNINLDFKGLADFSSPVNKFDFNTQVDFVNLNKLNLFTRDSIAVLKGEILVDFEGNEIDNITGKARFKNVSYTNQKKGYKFEDFYFESVLSNGIKTIKVVSEDIMSGQIKGVYNLSEIPELVQNSLGSMLSGYRPLKVAEKQFFEFDFQIYNEIVEAFLPEVRLAENTFIKGKVVDENKEIKLLLKSPKLALHSTVIDSLQVQVDNKNPALNTNISIKKIETPQYSIQNLVFFNKTVNDTLFFRTDFTGGASMEERFEISFYYTLDKDENAVLGFQKSKVYFKDKDWYINPSNNTKNKLVFDINKRRYSFENFNFSSQDQKVDFKGVLRDSTFKDLTLNFNQVNLHSISPKIDSLSLDGLLNGEFRFKQIKGVYQPLGLFSIEQFKINDVVQGNLKMDLMAEDSYRKYRVDLSLVNDSQKNIHANGYVDVDLNHPIVDLAVNVEDFKLNAFSPLGKKILTDTRGLANGNFNITGALSNPDVNGILKLTNAGLRFPYLNVDYDIVKNSTVKLKGQSFLFDGLVLRDSKYDTEAVMSGDISHTAFKDWRLDLHVKSPKLLVLDRQETGGTNYYGTGFILGEANFTGPTKDLHIDVKGKTLKNTKFIIPISDVKTVENNSLIHFKQKDKFRVDPFLDKKYLIKKFRGFSLNFDLEVTNKAEAEIVIDRVSGSSLKGRGSGNLSVEIENNGDFNIYGDYLIDSGIYNFVYGGFIDKPFEVKKGGLISWDGNPYDASLDVEAIHRVKANPKVLLNDLNTNRKVPIDLVTEIRGKLFNSTEKFRIVIPNSSSTVTSELDFVLNNHDENGKMRQFFSLLISKSFFNEENLDINRNTAISGTTSDIVSSALSDVFNKDEDKFRIDLAYTPGEKNDLEKITIDDQVDISLETQISDRVLIDGNIAVPVGDKTQSTVVGEVKVAFLMNTIGNLRWTIFSRQNEIQYSEEEEGYTQGIGLRYQIDFNNIREILSKIRFKNKERGLFQKGESE